MATYYSLSAHFVFFLRKLGNLIVISKEWYEVGELPNFYKEKIKHLDGNTSVVR